MATLYQRGAVYYLNWREHGQQWRKSLGKVTSTEAEKLRAAKEAQLTLGIRGIGASPTLSDWIDDYCASKPAKRRNDLKRVKAELGHHHIATLPPLAVEHYKNKRLETAQKETVGKEIRMLKAALNQAVALEVIQRNPVANIKAPRGIRSKAVKFYTKAQLRKIYAANKTMAPIWQFMANTGIRRGEFVKARRADVVGGSLRIESTEEGRTKSGKWREVALNPKARAALKDLGKDRLCPYAADTLTHRFATAAAQAGVGGNLHMLRHTFCSHLAMAGESMRTIQLLAGHSNLAMTEQYAHLAPKNKAEAVDKISL